VAIGKESFEIFFFLIVILYPNWMGSAHCICTTHYSIEIVLL